MLFGVQNSKKFIKLIHIFDILFYQKYLLKAALQNNYVTFTTKTMRKALFTQTIRKYGYEPFR